MGLEVKRIDSFPMYVPMSSISKRQVPSAQRMYVLLSGIECALFIRCVGINMSDSPQQRQRYPVHCAVHLVLVGIQMCYERNFFFLKRVACLCLHTST